MQKLTCRTSIDITHTHTFTRGHTDPARFHKTERSRNAVMLYIQSGTTEKNEAERTMPKKEQRKEVKTLKHFG